jgi:hypothetical protein
MARNEGSSEFGGFPLFRTIAIQSSLGLRAEGSTGRFPSIMGEARQADFSPTFDGGHRTPLPRSDVRVVIGVSAFVYPLPSLCIYPTAQTLEMS